MCYNIYTKRKKENVNMLKVTLKFARTQMSKIIESENELYDAERFLVKAFYQGFSNTDNFTTHVQELIQDGVLEIDEDYGYEEVVHNHLSECIVIKEI